MNCLAWRLVNGESVLRGRSHCPSCNHTLGVFDLIPVVSWLALRGRCRYCKAEVSARYVMVEVLMALAFVAVVAVQGFGIPTLVSLLLVCILMGLSLVDLDTYTIPNGFIGALVLLWLASVWFRVVPSQGFGVGSLFAGLAGSGWLAVALDGLAGAVAVGGGVLVISVVFDAVTKRTSLGGGDVKLLLALGLFLGLAGSLLNLLLACVLGLLFALVRSLLGLPSASHTQDAAGEAESIGAKAIPFGPAIASAALLTLLMGPTILTWYTGLFL